MISVILADDHRLMQDGLKSRLELEPNIRISACVSNGEEALNAALELNADVLLLDINMPGMSGLEVLEQLKQLQSELAVVILSMHDSRDYIMQAIALGAKGYVLKDVSSDELVMAINQVADGGSYFCAQVSQKLVQHLQPNASEEEEESLSPRENDVLAALANGDCNKAIADKLHISVRTVETHRLRIKRKLGVNSTAGLVKAAIERGLV
ncbi:response regulator [Aliagarivorans marinus]|uniref:response regulator n=1 Tax=Aliagarivorans marinus TaxID=561965 RepID=UPI0004261CC6|nr:response regulator transcription factor [Aliagarivorans marinus]